MILGIFISALGVVITRHQTREYFTSLRALEMQYGELMEELGRTQLELGTWATDARIERIALEKLQLQYPKEDNVVLLRP